MSLAEILLGLIWWNISPFAGSKIPGQNEFVQFQFSPWWFKLQAKTVHKSAQIDTCIVSNGTIHNRSAHLRLKHLDLVTEISIQEDARQSMVMVLFQLPVGAIFLQSHVPASSLYPSISLFSDHRNVFVTRESRQFNAALGCAVLDERNILYWNWMPKMERLQFFDSDTSDLNGHQKLDKNRFCQTCFLKKRSSLTLWLMWRLWRLLYPWTNIFQYLVSFQVKLK